VVANAATFRSPTDCSVELSLLVLIATKFCSVRSNPIKLFRNEIIQFAPSLRSPTFFFIYLHQESPKLQYFSVIYTDYLCSHPQFQYLFIIPICMSHKNACCIQLVLHFAHPAIIIIIKIDDVWFFLFIIGAPTIFLKGTYSDSSEHKSCSRKRPSLLMFRATSYHNSIRTHGFSAGYHQLTLLYITTYQSLVSHVFLMNLHWWLA